MSYKFQKDISGCGLVGVINKKGKKISGEVIKEAICLMNARGNGLGAGFAAYGIYPELKDFYAFHLMYHHAKSKNDTEDFIEANFRIEKKEPIPTKRGNSIIITNPPLLYRYFVKPRPDQYETEQLSDDDFVVRTVMEINSEIDGAYVFSSGKNMGAFKGVGYPRDIADFYQIDKYEAYIWTAHTRFPTNTPGWWGGAHPFTLLDWSIIHNGEISSYGINKRYLEMYGYKLTLLTDTEVVAYLFDLLIRRHGLDIKTACSALAPPFWTDIEDMKDGERDTYWALRVTYGSAVLNGPFAVIFGHKRGLVGFNDRIKLRPFVAGVKGDFVYMASEEAAIRQMEPNPDRVWAPRAGDPVIAELEETVSP